MEPEDLFKYDKLIAESADLRSKKTLEEQPALQERTHVQKIIWTKDETHCFCIESETSHLTIRQKKDKLEAVEELKNIGCNTSNGDALFADEGIYKYPSKQDIAQIILKGNVHLISSHIGEKKSYAIADQLSYDPIKKIFLFSAKDRVLFWQDGLTLSASEILVGPDQTIEGRGNVNFTFNLEEQNRIETFFKQYL